MLMWKGIPFKLRREYDLITITTFVKNLVAYALANNSRYISTWIICGRVASH